MTEQLHQRFSTEEIKTFLEEYLDEKSKLVYVLEILNITKRRFFQLLKEYRKDPDNFSIQYRRKRATRKINGDMERNIINELEREKRLIEGENSYQSLAREISPTPAASKGLIFLPYLKSERTPYVNPQARGAFARLSLQHDQRDLTRAIMERVIFALKQSVEEFEELGIDITSVTAYWAPPSISSTNANVS